MHSNRRPVVHDDEMDTWMRANVEGLVEFARELVRTPTENRPPVGNESAGQRLIADELRRLGADVDWFTPDEVPELRAHPAHFPTVAGRMRDFTDRPNVVGTFRGSGGGHSVLFSTHVDTVPARSSAWTVAEPFSGEVKDGRLYGRGSYDSKGAIASHIFALRWLSAHGVTLRGDVIVESVVDEEFGGSHGALASRLRGHNADIGFNSEPTHLDVCLAHRGGREAYLVIGGDPGMAFRDEALQDPVAAIAQSIRKMVEFNEKRNRTERVPDLYKSDPGLPLYFNQVGGGGTSYEEAIGTPDECYVLFWAEVYEGTSAEEFDEALMKYVHRGLADIGYPIERARLIPTTRFLPGSSMARDHPALNVLRDAYRTADRQFVVRGAPFACDAYIFNLYSPTPAIILGPGGGGAHAPDEYVLISDLLDLARISARFILTWCGVS